LALYWKLSGSYFETCNCESACPCVLLSPATHKNCDVVLAWHINGGQFGDTKLDGLNAVMMAQSPESNRIMFDGNWKAALYVDKNASETQTDAIMRIFSGKAGGPFAEVAKLITQFLGTRTVAIDFRKEDGKFSLTVPNVMNASIEAIKNPEGRVVEVHNAIGSSAEPTYVARSTANNLTDYGMSWSYSAKNGFYDDFAYSDP
jgi:hypothetical protein